MKFISRYSLILLLGFILSYCNSAKKDETASNEDLAENQIPVTDVVTGYMNLKDAFVATDYNVAKSAAITFKEVVAGNVDAAFEKALLSVTNKVIDANSVEEQRLHFEQISTLMYALAQNGQFEGKVLYKQFCPMAFDNKGAYWLSLDENILNPYFGDRMLKCGYVEEIL